MPTVTSALPRDAAAPHGLTVAPVATSAQEAFAKRIHLLYKNLLTGVSFGSLTLVMMLVPMFRQGPLHPLVQWWAIASALWLCVGFGLCWGYRRRVRQGNADARFWAYIASAGGAIAGLLWGSLGLVVMRPELQQFETYVVTGLCLLSVGAALGYAVYLPAMVGFSIGIIVPLSASFIAVGDSMHVVMAILSLQCCAALIAFGVEFNRALRNEFELTSRVSALARDLEAEKQQVLAASAAKSRFLAAASHDLRQPVHSISLYVGALGRFVSEGEGARTVNRLQGSVRALDGLFEGLQDISRIDAGVVPVQQRAFALSMLFDAIDMQFRAGAELKGLKLVFEPSDAVVESDRMLLERILSNLVSNAIRYTPAGRVTVRAVRERESVVVQVEDTGIGIAEEHRELIFEEFVQIGNPERDRSKGLGLGLAIVRRLAEILRHPLTLESVPGRGSVFSLRLPAVSLGAAFVDPAAAPVQATEPPSFLPGSFVLVIDDEKDVLDATAIVLEQAGAHVLKAVSGDDAVDRIGQEDRMPDIVMSDLRLRGGESGIAAVARVREAIGEPIPALLVTGDTAPERVAEATASGFTLLHKPLRPEALVAALARGLEPAS